MSCTSSNPIAVDNWLRVLPLSRSLDASAIWCPVPEKKGTNYFQKKIYTLFKCEAQMRNRRQMALTCCNAFPVVVPPRETGFTIASSGRLGFSHL